MNETIYFLFGFEWVKGSLIKENAKTFKIAVPRRGGFVAHERNVLKEKCAFPDEEICIVWEMWKGKNGRGAYRIEREGYVDSRVPARTVSSRTSGRGRINEEAQAAPMGWWSVPKA